VCLFERPCKALIFVFATIAVLGACQPVPRIFQPDQKATLEFADFAMADKRVVFVAGIDNAPPAIDRALVAALVERLQAHDIAASATTANRGSYILTCDAHWDSAETVTLAWRLIDAEGLVVGLVDQRSTADPRAWAGSEPALVVAIVDEAAPRLAAIIGDHDPAVLAGATPGLLRAVYVRPVRGAPGDGNAALTQAMRAVLKTANLSLSPEPPRHGIHVRGDVSVVTRNAFEQVTIRWRVVDTAGAELGVVSQSNQIAAGSLDGAWGPIAMAVAQGGAEGVIRILSEIGAPGSSVRR